MAASIASNPGVLWYPGGQPLIYRFTTNLSPVPDGFRFVITVEENGTSIGKYYVSRNPANIGVFDLQQAIRGRVAVDSVDSAGIPIHKAATNFFAQGTNGVKYYKVKVGEWNGTTETTNDASANIWLVDGYIQQSSGLHPGFSDYYATADTKQVWLTERARVGTTIEVNAASDDEGVVAFLSNSAVSEATQVIVSRYSTSGVFVQSQTIAINTTNGARLPSDSATTYPSATLLYFPVFPASLEARLGWGLTADNWGHLRINLANASFAPESPVIRINRDCRPSKHTPVQLAWTNPLGGWDYLRFDGRPIHRQKTESKEYRPLLGTWGAATFTLPASQPGILPYHLEAKWEYELTQMITAAESRLLRSALRARQHYARIDGVWLPVILRTQSAEIVTSTISKLTEAKLSIELAQEVRC